MKRKSRRTGAVKNGAPGWCPLALLDVLREVPVPDGSKREGWVGLRHLDEHERPHAGFEARAPMEAGGREGRGA